MESDNLPLPGDPKTAGINPRLVRRRSQSTQNQQLLRGERLLSVSVFSWYCTVTNRTCTTGRSILRSYLERYV